MTARVIIRCHECNVKMLRVDEQPETATGDHPWPTEHGTVVFSGPGAPVAGDASHTCPPMLPPEDNPDLAAALRRSRETGRPVTITAPAWVGGVAVEHTRACQTKPPE